VAVPGSTKVTQKEAKRNSCSTGVVVQLVEALRYKPEGHGFNSRKFHWNFSLIQFFRSHCSSGIDSAANRNEYQDYFLRGKGGRCIGQTTLPPSFADCLGIWESQPPGNLRSCPHLQWDCFTFSSTFIGFTTTTSYSKTCLKRTPYIPETWTNGK